MKKVHVLNEDYTSSIHEESQDFPVEVIIAYLESSEGWISYCVEIDGVTGKTVYF